MTQNAIKPWLESRELTPAGYPDGVMAPQRGSRFGEAVVQPVDRYRLAEEGKYFVATNAALGTAIITHAAPDADTKASLLLRNANPLGSGINIYLDFLKLYSVAVGTNGTTFGLTGFIDPGPTALYSSGGTAITPVAANSGATGATLHFGAVVAAAMSADKRKVLQQQLRASIKVAADVYLLEFGGKDLQAVATPASAAIAGVRVPCPPVVLPPGASFLLRETAASQSVAASYEFTLAYWER
jgi:hypothetical protein